MLEYNEERDHDGLGGLTPIEACNTLESPHLSCLLDGEAYAPVPLSTFPFQNPA